MGFSPLASMSRRITACPKYSQGMKQGTCRQSPRNAPVTGVLVHYNYGVNAYGEATNPNRVVSANYWIANDGTLIPNIDENYRAWTSGAQGYPNGALADRYSITVEVSNVPGFKESSPMGAISPAAYKTLTMLIGDVFKRYKLGAVKRTTSPTAVGVRGHNDFVPTSCPGPWIASRWGQIIKDAEAYRVSGKTPPAPAPAPSGNSGFSVAYIKDIQTRLIKAGYSVGKSGVDGSLGPDTTKAVKAFQKAKGLEQDGLPGPLTLAALKGSAPKPAPAPKPATGKLDVDGRFGPASTKRLQAVLGTLQDGVLSGQASVNKKYHPRLLAVQYGLGGSTAVRALQGKLGVTKDAQIGPNTIKAWQRKLGVTADGYFGPNSATAAQNALNKGKLW